MRLRRRVEVEGTTLALRGRHRGRSAWCSAWMPILGLVLVGPGRAAAQLSVAGEAGLELRAFDQRPLYDGQRFHALGAWVAPRASLPLPHGQRLELAPFVRVLNSDPSHPVAYLRTLAWSGSFGRARATLGIRRVRWGVARAASPVDIVTQKDRSFHPLSNERMGQPMATAELPVADGVLEILVMSRVTARVHAGREGRLRGAAWVLPEEVDYGRGAGHRVEWATRWSGRVHGAELGLSVFDGTSRDPAYDRRGATLIQRYESLRQLAIDVQRDIGPLTVTAESAARALAGSSPFVVTSVGLGAGLEGRSAGLDVLVEYIADTRGQDATSIIEDDVYVEAKLRTGAPRSLSVTLKLLADREGDGSVWTASLDRDVGASWRLALSTWRFRGADLAALRGDGYVAVALRHTFGVSAPPPPAAP